MCRPTSHLNMCITVPRVVLSSKTDKHRIRPENVRMTVFNEKQYLRCLSTGTISTLQMKILITYLFNFFYLNTFYEGFKAYEISNG